MNLVIAFLILLSIVSKKLLGKIFNPIFVMNILWALILFLSSLNLYNLFPTPDHIYKYIIIGLVSYNIGFLLIYTFNMSLNSPVRVISPFKVFFDIRENLLVVLCVVSIIFMIPAALNSLGVIISGGGSEEIRTMNQQGIGVYSLKNSSSILNSLNILIIQPFTFAITTVSFVNFWSDRRSKKVSYLTVIILVLSVLGSGGRILLLNSIFSLVISFLFMKKKLSLSKKVKRRLIYLVTIVFLFIIVFSITRASGHFKQTIYYYFAMPPYMFSTWEKAPIGIMGYGMASLNGLLFPILYLFKNIIGVDFPQYFQQIYNLVQSTDSTWVTITASGSNANAYVSIFWFLLVDGGIFGIITGMILLGGILSQSFCSAVNKLNEKSVAIYVYLLNGIFFSFVRFPFVTTYYSIGFIFILLIVYRKTRIRL